MIRDWYTHNNFQLCRIMFVLNLVLIRLTICKHIRKLNFKEDKLAILLLHESVRFRWIWAIMIRTKLCIVFQSDVLSQAFVSFLSSRETKLNAFIVKLLKKGWRKQVLNDSGLLLRASARSPVWFGCFLVNVPRSGIIEIINVTVTF